MSSKDDPTNVDVRTSAKRKLETPASRASKIARTSNTPNVYARRSPPRDRPRSRSRSRSRSPPRKLKRPGARATADRDTTTQLQKEREDAARAEVANRQISSVDLVAEHYNAVPERGREWRSTESKIKGLRSVNNWIKSTLIQKFSRPDGMSRDGELFVIDLAAGKGGDVGKWQKAPVVPRLYVGCDIADISISQARQRYDDDMQQRQRRGQRGPPPMQAEFYVQDAFGKSLDQLKIVRQVGFDPSVGPASIIQPGMRSGGFDVVSMMFALHYSFESETLARGMLFNVSGALKKGGRFIGVMPNSNVISATLKKLMSAEGGVTPADAANGAASTNGTAVSNEQLDADHAEEGEWDPEAPGNGQQAENHLVVDDDDEEEEWDPEKPADAVPLSEEQPSNTPDAKSEHTPSVAALTPATPVQWGNALYNVRFDRLQKGVAGSPRVLPRDGVFRPPFGWKYHYSLQEAVDAPEYVVPFEALRALAEEYGLELMYRKGFREVFDEERGDPELGRLAERMGVLSRDRSEGDSGCLVSEEEWEAASFYHAFVFYKA